jgi:Ca2+-binding RTX toxin-like protein
VRISSWIKRRQRRRSSSPAISTRLAQAEALEVRSLPSVSALVVGTDLNISSDGDDSIQVSAFAGNVLVVAGPAGGIQQPISSIGSVPASSIQSIIITGGDQENAIDLGNVLATDFLTLASIVVQSGNGDDLLTGSPDFANHLHGQDGRDTLLGGTDNDTLDGGDGADSINGLSGNDSILAGNGTDNISGDDGNDTLDGGNGSDTISSGNGDDSVFAGNGEDSLNGDAGDDTLNGDGGTDTVSGDDGNDSILGGEFDDSLVGGTGSDTLNGQAGNDTLTGDAGNDSLLGGVGHDSLTGADGDDLLNGNSGNDLEFGNDGADLLYGGSGNDQLFGDNSDVASLDTGNDLLFGQSGEDSLLGGKGSDTLEGGEGNDLVSTQSISIAPPPPPPPATPPVAFIDDVTLAAEGNSGTTSAVFTVSLSRASTSLITIDYTTVDGLATMGSDYQLATAQLQFQPGVTTQTITAFVNGDTLGECLEDFTVNLSNPTNVTLLDSSGRALITDDDRTLTPIPVDPFYAGNYSAVSLGSIPGLPPLYGGLTIDPLNPDILLVGGDANTSAGALYAIQIERDAL